MFPAAYYNVGSTALVLVLIALAIAGFFWFRSRRTRKAGGVALAPDDGHDEENIPLTQAGNGNEYDPLSNLEANGNRKGKGKARDPDLEPKSSAVFDVGDSDDEDDHQTRR